MGRYGPFIEQGERRGSLRDEMAPDELTVEAALEILAQAAQAEEPLGNCPETGKPVYLKVGRFGPYVQRGNPEDEEKPKNASLLKGMKPEDVTLDVALKLLSLPRELGTHPGERQPGGGLQRAVRAVRQVRRRNAQPAGRYVADRRDARAGARTVGQAQGGTARLRRPKEPLKVFEESPVTKEKIQLLEGRYGLYLTDGETNASLPKGLAADEMTREQALELLAARAALGPSKKSAKRKTAKKSAAKKKTSPGDGNGRVGEPARSGQEEDDQKEDRRQTQVFQA